MSSSPQTAPAWWYRDPERWRAEQSRLFARSWQFAVHDSDLAQTGAWRAETLAGYPVLLVRDHAGAVRGFHNVCRHRASPLVNAEAGVCDGALTCPYHGWRYGLDGRLRSARDFGAAGDFDPREYGLLPVTLAHWRGLWFAAIAEAPPLADALAPLDQRLAGKDWSDLRVAARRTHVLDCNWKTYVENYLEGYHVPMLHPSLDAEIRSDLYEVSVEGRVALHRAPQRESGGVYEGLWAWAWPNIGVNVYRRGLMVERMSPLGADRTQLDYVYLTPHGEAVTSETLAMADRVTAEDKWVVERVQLNLNAGIYERGRLSPKHEVALAAFQTWVGEALNSD
jgi:choline monooxygenase